MKSQTFHIRIKEWFPPGDEVAAIMARLCVLREDLYLEMLGLHQDEIKPLDANGDNYRSTYFFCNSTRRKSLKNRCLRNLHRRRISDRVRMDASHISVSRPEF